MAAWLQQFWCQRRSDFAHPSLVAPSLQLLAPGLWDQGARPSLQASLQRGTHLCEVEGCRFTPIVAVAVHVQHLHAMRQRLELFAWPL
jgi:hypothetical protein